MKVITRTDIKGSYLTGGKEYEVIKIFKGGYNVGVNVVLSKKEPHYLVFIIDDSGMERSLWNDYFLSTEEMRDRKLNMILRDKKISDILE